MHGTHRIETVMHDISLTRGSRHTKVRSNNLYTPSSHLHLPGHPLAIFLRITSFARVLRNPKVHIFLEVTPCHHLHRLALTKLRLRCHRIPMPHVQARLLLVISNPNAGIDTQWTIHTRSTGGVVLGAKRTRILASAKMLLGNGVDIRIQAQVRITDGSPTNTGSGRNLAPQF